MRAAIYSNLDFNHDPYSEMLKMIAAQLSIPLELRRYALRDELLSSVSKGDAAPDIVLFDVPVSPPDALENVVRLRCAPFCYGGEIINVLEGCPYRVRAPGDPKTFYIVSGNMSYCVIFHILEHALLQAGGRQL